MGQRWTVPPREAGMRLDRFLAETIRGTTRRRLQRLILSGAVRVNGSRAVKGLILRGGDEVEIAGAIPTDDALRPTPDPDAPLEVAHVDDAIVVIVKPAGIPTQPLAVGERGTVANALVARYPDCAGASPDPRDAGLAQRLDIDTSGLVVAARSRSVWELLRASFRAGAVTKEYLAVVDGDPGGPLTIDHPLRAAPGDPRRVVAVTGGVGRVGDQEATTRVEVVTVLRDAALVRARTSTGRRHQIRAHLAAAGYPLRGDRLYGGSPGEGPPGHLLHAARLSLPHPVTGASLTLEAPLPEAFHAVVEGLRIGSPGAPTP